MRHCTILLLFVSLQLTNVVRGQFLQWAHSVSGVQAEQAFATAVDQQGAVYSVGSFVLTVDFDPGPGASNVTSNGSSDAFVQKLNGDGSYGWGYGLGAGGADQALAVAVDADGNVVITGRASGTFDLDPTAGVQMVTSANTSFDVFVIKLSTDGVFLWGRLFGANGNDAGQGIAIGPGGTIFTTGYVTGIADLDPGPGVVSTGGFGQQDIFVHQLDASGLFVWGHVVGGNANDQAYGCAVDQNGDVFLTGEFRTTVDFDPGPAVLSLISGGAEDAFAMKWNGTGDVLWAHRFGGTGSERSRAVAVGPDGGPVFTGRITSVTDFDPGAAVLNLPGSFQEPSFLLKLTEAGDFQWAFLLTSFLNEGRSVAVDGLNNIHTCGSFGTSSNTPLDLDPGAGVTAISSNGGGDLYMASYTAQGAFRWGFGLGGAQSDIAHGIALGQQGRFVLVGEFRQTLDMEPGPDVVLLTNGGGQDAFMALFNKPDCQGVFVDVEAILAGPFEEDGLAFMRDDLRTAGLIPLQEPYTAMGFQLDEPAITTPQVLAATLSAAIVDWVMVELRDDIDPAEVVGRRAGLIRRDGQVVAVDGVSSIGFCVGDGSYHVVVRHRNHFGTMTAEALDLTSAPTSIDFTDAATPTYGTDARMDLGNDLMALWKGNVVPDGVVRYSGSENDRDPILARIGGVVATATASGYFPEDLNLDGVVRYAGASNDRDIILQVIGGSVPTATRVQQLP
jgi:hypothetical protein